ncbi:hypothetical protein Syun_029186 [Stephania yunnanensis]|uniref:Uncharacterized protein n=1 Tax=Stephania yunnanensis TaxID=152371 RepID=A0AAP0E9H1_9MAGN
MAEAVARDKVRDPVECTDRDNGLVMHKDKDMNMFHLDRDFNVPVWECGQPGITEPEQIHAISTSCPTTTPRTRIEGDRWYVLCLEVSEEPSSSRRAQPYKVRWGYGLGLVWPWAVARVRAERHVSRPELESVGLVPRLNDLLVGTPCYLASLID